MRSRMCEADSMRTLVWIPVALLLLSFSDSEAYALQGAMRNTSTEPCVDGTLFCKSDCTGFEICVGDTPVPIAECPPGTSCNSDTLKCVTDFECPAASVTPVAITCHGLGYFPDPSDCKSYHICSTNGGLSTVQTCEQPTAYDPLTFTCSKTDADRVCKDRPVPKCNRNLDKGPQIENPNVYYICLFDDNGNLVPNLYKCPEGEIYDGSKCVLGSTSSTESTTTSGGVSTPASYTCIAEGRFPVISVENGSGSYVLCTSELIPYHFDCSEGCYYDTRLNRCRC